MKVQYATTTGTAQFDNTAATFEYASDPEPPSDDPAWVMVGSTITELRYSQQTILWFWRKESDNERQADLIKKDIQKGLIEDADEHQKLATEWSVVDGDGLELMDD